MSRHTLTRALVDGGRIEKVTLNMTLFSSPVFRRPDRGLCTIAGFSFSVDVLQNALVDKDRLQLVDSWYEVEVTLPRSVFERGDWFVPPAAVPHLSVGEYAVQGFEARTRFVTNTVGDPCLKGFAHIVAAAGFAVDVPSMFGIAAQERIIRLRRLWADDFFDGSCARR